MTTAIIIATIMVAVTIRIAAHTSMAAGVAMAGKGSSATGCVSYNVNAHPGTIGIMKA
ncbi:hypothetical protein Gdia_1176 [Gluconacetobacter diazotrophicus PA1 5]|uniref:hypothetical protein n=1 Tax=Gluconacetobacter diazotrophicus TaxID=33996 RepID=UPI000173CF49|nr:hypothetical protein [Gluconacetobacter diazotrophicus]ACI50959.1 hypothetical protein Gdia_1176 [Gluconacetobacter diazotrophicus PA1 5]TWB08586.1 hypothetical protein FBZ86_10683 [Gluconacetobacter diazotrophicus]